MGISKAIVYIAHGSEYVKEALKSIKSVGDQYPCIVCASGRVKRAKTFILPPRQYKQWFLDRVAYFNLIAQELPYDQLLLLDSDTYVCGDISGFFEVLDRFDIAGTHAISRHTILRDDIPCSFPELHCGAFSFNRNDKIRRLFARWFQIYQNGADIFDNDQPPLRQALWEDRDIRLAILPPEFCFRYRWGGVVRMKVRLLHGKENSISHEEIAERVNGMRGIRFYRRRELA